MNPVPAWIGLGANLGDAQATIVAALAAIARLDQCRLTAVSSLYRSAPIQASGPDFLNAAVSIETTQTPQALLGALLAIERRHGRQRPYRNAPRTLDLDLLAWDGAIIHEPQLTLPHPRLHERAFVLAPLLEIAPTLRLPGLAPLAQLLAACTGQRVERVMAPQALRDLSLASEAPR